MEHPSPRTMYIEILGRRYKTRTVINVLLFGPLLIWLIWATFGVRLVLFVVEKIGSADNNIVQNLGQTGDLFGGVSALFAAYAFAGVAVAAYFQHKTFVVVEDQQKQQSFEPLFFKLLELNRALRPEKLQDDMTMSRDLHDVVEELAEQIVTPVERGDLGSESTKEIGLHVSGLYAECYRKNEAVLGPYFRTLYHVFKLIDTSGLPKPRRVEYANIGRASLNRDELVLLMFNCVTSRGAEFKPLVEKYGLLKHLPVVPRDLRHFARRVYEPTALMHSAKREKHWQANEQSRPTNMPAEEIDPAMTARES